MDSKTGRFRVTTLTGRLQRDAQLALTQCRSRDAGVRHKKMVLFTGLACSTRTHSFHPPLFLLEHHRGLLMPRTNLQRQPFLLPSGEGFVPLVSFRMSRAWVESTSQRPLQNLCLCVCKLCCPPSPSTPPRTILAIFRYPLHVPLFLHNCAELPGEPGYEGAVQGSSRSVEHVQNVSRGSSTNHQVPAKIIHVLGAT